MYRYITILACKLNYRCKINFQISNGKQGPLKVYVRIDGIPTVGMWGMYYKLEVHKYGDVTHGCRAVGPIYNTATLVLDA